MNLKNVKNIKGDNMNLYLREITIDDKIEILKMIEEIKEGDDPEKFEGLSI